MDDLLTGLPLSIPAARIPRTYLRLAKELCALRKIADISELSTETLDKNIECLLQNRVDMDDEEAPFQLGQIQLEKHFYCSAWKNFQIGFKRFNDMRCKYQIAMMLYDNWVDINELKNYKDPRKEACKLFEEIVQLPFGVDDPKGQRDLVYSAAYNLGRACYQGFGYYPSIDKAIEYFEFAAADGDPKASVLAQTALGYIYCGPDRRDLKKAFYWHTQACGNGSVESQAALGVMYLYGLGVQQDWASALLCLSESADRGSLYGMASLAYLYYKRKMYTNAAMTACKIAFFEKDQTCVDTDCLNNFINRAKAMGCFIYARCLQQGLGVKQNETLAEDLYSQSISYDSALASRYQLLVIQEAL